MKGKLYAAIKAAGLGNWVSKPIEQDMFIYQHEPALVVETANVQQMAPPIIPPLLQDPNKPMIMTPAGPNAGVQMKQEVKVKQESKI